MSRTVWYAGTPRPMQTNGGNTPTWPGIVINPTTPMVPMFPDVDPLWSRPAGGGSFWKRFPDPNRVRVPVRPFSAGRAFCLAPQTDWDFLDVLVDDDPTPVRLAPGVLIRKPFTKLSVKMPAETQPPATRWVRGAGQQDVQIPVTPQLPPGIGLVIDNAGTHVQVKATGGATITFQKWNGNAWVPGTGPLVNVGDTGLVSLLGQSLVSSDGNGYRPVDVSPDGVYSLADLFAGYGLNGQSQYIGPAIQNGVPVNRQYNGTLIDNRVTTTLFVGSFTLDNNQNPGDATSPTTAIYISPFDLSNAEMSTAFVGFFGRAAIEVWDGEDPPCDYHPLLPADRVIELGPYQGGNIGAVLAGNVPNTPLVAVPAFNVFAATYQAVLEFGSTQPLFAAIAQGNAYEDFMFTFGPAPAQTWRTYTVLASPVATQANAGQALSCQAQLNGAAYLQVQIGSGNGLGASILRTGSQLTLRRAFCG